MDDKLVSLFISWNLLNIIFLFSVKLMFIEKTLYSNIMLFFSTSIWILYTWFMSSMFVVFILDIKKYMSFEKMVIGTVFVSMYVLVLMFLKKRKQVQTQVSFNLNEDWIKSSNYDDFSEYKNSDFNYSTEYIYKKKYRCGVICSNGKRCKSLLNRCNWH